MATEHILSLLIAERNMLNKAIEALGGSATPVSHPSKSSESPAPAPVAAAPAKKRKTLTAAQKKHQSERMKAFWAARRKKLVKA